MKKTILLSLFAFMTVSASAQTMADVFREMPDSLMPLLTKNNRLDCIDFLESKMQAKVRNKFGDYVEMTHLTDSYLRMELSPVSEMEARLLPVDSTVVVCLVRTYAGPARESVVEFYDTQWEKQNWVDLPAPSVEDYWASAPDSVAEDAKYACASLRDLPLVQVTLSADAPTLTFTLQTSELREKEKEVAQQLVHPIVFLWNGREFGRQ